MSEPREFWIDDFLSDKADFVTCVSRAPKTHFIHVIEKSAYDALEARCEKLDAALTEWLAFEQKCIDRDGPYDSPNIPRLMEKARQALAQDEMKDE